MKSKDIKDVRTKDANTLAKMVMDKKLEIDKLLVQLRGGKGDKNIKKVWVLRREIAQLLTIARENQIIKQTTN